MEFSTLRIRESDGIINAEIDRKQQRNSINRQLIKELTKLMDISESRPEVKMLVISGNNDQFCTGMDFEEAVNSESFSQTDFADYMNVLKRISLSPKIVVARVEGQVLAGGVGVAAACDLVLATHDSKFGLSELLWGLVPAMVMPFLVRRIGFQSAYRMAMTTETLSAEQASRLGLVDVVDSDLDVALRRMSSRLLRVESDSVKHLKHFMRDMWILTEPMEELAVAVSYRLGTKPKVQHNLERFVRYGQFPWE